MDPARLVEELRRPGAWPERPDEVGFLQTHCSWLFFAGASVYKVKKPVDFGFLDFSTLERRRRVCEDEVRLNQRLAPGVYRGVVPLVAGEGGLRVGAGPDDGEPVEWAVAMRRLPAARMLDALLERGEIDNERIGQVVELLATFHAEAATGPGVDEHGAPEAVAANTEENFTQLEPYVVHAGGPAPAVPVLGARHFGFLVERCRNFLARRRDLFERRVAEGRVRDGHGDLHAGNLCFTDDGPVAYDRIEFNDRFRCGDVAADLAFLAMDLDDRGFRAFSGYLVKLYAERTNDDELRELMPFYKAYRAVVRGKVSAFAASDEGLEEAARAAHRARALRYLTLAGSYELPPALFLMCGLPATGKSWLARHLARSQGAILLRSDVRRKQLARMAPTTRVRDGYDTGMYSHDMKERTYRSLLEDALEHLQHGHPCIVDATFSRAVFRAPYVDAATRLELPFHVIHVTASEEVVRERMDERARDPANVSDADWEVYLREKEAFEPPDEVPAGHVVELPTGHAPETQGARLLEHRIATETGRGAVAG